MGFVVYEKEDGRAVRYYKKESTAKAQVTKQNRRVTLALLKGEVIDDWNFIYLKEYAHCSWADFEAVLEESNFAKPWPRSHEF
jgi:hypothetical protein